MAQHGVELLELGHPGAQLVGVGAHLLGHLFDLVIGLRQELMKRRVEQADRDGQTRHDLEQLDEVVPLHRQDLGKSCAAGLHLVGDDHFSHRHDALGIEEHVFGAAQADPFRAEVARGAGIERGFGIGAHTHAAEGISPGHQQGEIARELGLDGGHLALHHLARRTIDRDRLTLLQRDAHDGEGPRRIVDAERPRA